MTTNLIIQVLSEEDAETLRNKIFGDLAKIVKGTYSETYGLMISFGDWINDSYSSAIVKFLYDEPKIKMRPDELMYYEFYKGGNYCEEVDFSELFPMAGFYKFDRAGVVKFQVSTARIYYRGNHTCTVHDTSVIRYWIERDQILKSGISKIYRRGFIDKETEYKWMNELYQDILAS